MDVLLLTIGSHGDVHPFIGIGRALSARGHRVRLGTNAYFAELVQRAGLEFVEIGTREQFTRLLADPLIWHALKGPGRILEGVGEMIDDVFDLTLEHASFETTIVGSSLALGALVAAERFKLNYATVHLSPVCVRSRVAMPTMPGSLNLSWLPRGMKRALWNGTDRWFIDPMIAPRVNRLRARVGLEPIEHILDWWHAPMLTIGLWPAWFSPPPPDAPAQLRLTGFPLYDEADHQTLAPELAQWLADGDAPIAFTPGSAMAHGGRFFEVAAEACDRLDRRGLLLTRHIEQIPGRLPPMVRHLAYAPFSQLLPRCAALVHHGGIGTVSQSLRAGTPQLIMPMSHDQPDNAGHVRRLGVGDSVARSLFKPKRVERKLERLLLDPLVRQACDSIASKFTNDDAMTRTVELIEQLGAPTPKG